MKAKTGTVMTLRERAQLVPVTGLKESEPTTTHKSGNRPPDWPDFEQAGPDHERRTGRNHRCFDGLLPNQAIRGAG